MASKKKTYTANTELALDGGNQGRALEQGTGQGLEGTGDLGLAAGDLAVQACNTHVLLTGTLLRLDQARGTVNADNQTTSDLGIKGTRVTSLLDAVESQKLVVFKLCVLSRIDFLEYGGRDAPKNALDPGNDFVRRRVRGLVQVDDTRADVRLEVAAQRRAAVGDGREVTGADLDWTVSDQR